MLNPNMPKYYGSITGTFRTFGPNAMIWFVAHMTIHVAFIVARLYETFAT